MSTLQVANVHLESTGNNRVQYLGSNTVGLYAGGSLVLSANSTNTYGSNLGKQTFWIPATIILANVTTGPGTTTAQTATSGVVSRSLDFDTAIQEYAQFGIQMPKKWNEGTLVCQFVWYQATTAAGGVVFSIQSTSYANAEGIDSTNFGTAVTATTTGGTGNTVYVSPETSAMTVGGSPTQENYVVFRVTRDVANASDTLAQDARLLGVKIAYTVDAGKDD
jgi:hypothetical protein